MNKALRQHLTTTGFLDWEARQNFRYEFDGTKVIAMTGGTAAHSTIQGNLARAIGGRLSGTSCRFHGSDLKIEVSGRIRYPDGFVVCSPVSPKTTVVRDPVVIFEVLSESTEDTDIFVKNREYASTPSVIRYVMLSQNEISAILFERVEADWLGRVLAADAVLSMPEIGLEVALSELYTGLHFTADPTSAPSS